MRRIWLVSAAIMVLLLITPVQADDNFSFRLSPGPRLVGTRADSSGSGLLSAKLSGNTLSLDGTYGGLLGVPTAARLLMGSAPGVRGPRISDLTISQAVSGTINGKIKLGAKQLAAFRNGGLYVEIDSINAPDGDLWGWVMPPAE